MSASAPPNPNRAAYDARWQRIIDLVEQRRPDRMPIVLYATFWLAKYGNVSHKELMYDYEKTRAIAERAILDLDPDAYAPLVLLTASGRVLEAIGYKQLQWPGHGVGEHQPFQYLDREYMKPEDFDEFLLDPTGFYLHTYLPRVASAFEGFEELPQLPGQFYFRILTAMRGFANPRVQQAMQNVIKAGEEAERFVRHHVEFTARMTNLGYPLVNGGSSGAPYDVIADYFRGARGMMTDLYRNKDKLLELLDKMCVFLSRMTIANARAAGHPIVIIPIHWAPDAFMSDKQFREFWWPSFRRMILNLIDANLIPMPLWEADCTKRLEIIRDVPPGKCIYWFERTDMVKAFEVLGDVVALRGNLPPLVDDDRDPAGDRRRGQGASSTSSGTRAASSCSTARSACRTRRPSRTCARCSPPAASTLVDERGAPPALFCCAGSRTRRMSPRITFVLLRAHYAN